MAFELHVPEPGSILGILYDPTSNPPTPMDVSKKTQKIKMFMQQSRYYCTHILKWQKCNKIITTKF